MTDRLVDIEANAAGTFQKLVDMGDGTFSPRLNATTRSVVSSLIPTVTASAYSSGNAVGGLLTFPSITDAALTGVIESIVLNLKTVVTVSFRLYLFNANPTASTFTDQSAPSINAADVNKIIGSYSISTSDSSLGTHTNYVVDSIGKSFTSTSDNKLYGVLIVNGAYTPASTSDVQISIGILKD